MKRIVGHFLCALLAILLFAACAPAPARAQMPPLEHSSGPAPGTPAPEPKPLASGLAARFFTADLQTVRLDTDLTVGGSHKAVRVTAGLMQTLGNLFASDVLKELETPMRGISGDFPSCMAQFMDGETYISLQLFGPGSREIYSKQTVLWLQVGEETAQYTAPAALYERFCGPLDEATYDHVVRVTGKALPLALPEPKAPLYLESVLQFDGCLAFLRTDQEQNRLNLLDSADGSLLCSLKPREPVERIEQNPDDPGLLRVYTKSGVSDYRPDGSLVREWTLPPEVTRHFAASDRYAVNRFSERGDKVLFGTADGVWLWEGEGEPRQVLSNADLPEALGNKMPPASPAESLPVYFEPRLMNGGRTALASVDIPGSQSGRVGLAILTLETGEVRHRNNLFSAMTSELSYPDDQTVVAHGNGINRIDLVSGECETRIDFGGLVAPDGSFEVRSDRSLTPEGIPVHALQLCRGMKEEPLLRVDGDSFSLCFVTRDFAVCSYEDSVTSGFLAVPLTGGDQLRETGYSMTAALPVVTGREEKLAYQVNNDTGSRLFYGLANWLERLEDGQWRAVTPLREIPFPEISVDCPAWGSGAESLNLKGDYERPLPPGEYRIGKELGFDRKRCYAPFRVE